MLMLRSTALVSYKFTDGMKKQINRIEWSRIGSAACRHIFLKKLAPCVLATFFCSSSLAESLNEVQKPFFSVENAVTAEWYVDVSNGVVVLGKDDNGMLDSHTHSPDGKRAFYITRKGDLKNNSVDMTLHLVTYDRGSLHHSELIKISSFSNEPAIENVKWFDSENIIFVAREGGEEPVLISIDINGVVSSRINSKNSSVIGFDLNSKGQSIFGVLKSSKSADALSKFERGYVVVNETFSDLAGGKKSDGYKGVEYYYSVNGEIKKIDKVTTQYSFLRPFMSMSPSGRYAIVSSAPRTVPQEWKSLPLIAKPTPGEVVHWYHLELALIDIKLGQVFKISGAPMAFPDNKIQVVWDERHNRVILIDQFFSLKQANHINHKNRQESVIFEYSLTQKKPTYIIDTTESPSINSYNRHKVKDIKYENNTLWVKRSGGVSKYVRIRAGWCEEKIDQELSPFTTPPFSLYVEQNYDLPPQMKAKVSENNEVQIVSNINSYLQDRYNPSSKYSWRDKDGNEWRATLILPKENNRQQHLPLVIQTHAFSETEFLITGPRGAGAGFSAQALASAGFAVLNIGLPNSALAGAFNEFEVMSKGFISAVAALASEDIIDPERVGVIAWSRSGLWLQHTLSFHSDLVKAAVVSDAGTFGKFSYLFMENWPSVFQQDFLTQNAIPPFGSGGEHWRVNDPVTRVRSFKLPLRLNDFDEGHPLWWEAYVAMKYALEPVEYFHLPSSPHNPVKPMHQLYVQSSTIDWFRFWLKGEVNAQPLDHNQYARWRKLKDIKCTENNEKSSPFYC